MLADWSTICKFDMLCLCLDCHVISSSGLQFYTYFWMAMLYHLLVCKFIPMSGLQVYTYFCYKVLYLLLLWLLLLFPNLISDLLYLFLVCNFIPMSVISNSGLFNFTGYGIVRYIVFRAPLSCSNFHLSLSKIWPISLVRIQWEARNFPVASGHFGICINS